MFNTSTAGQPIRKPKAFSFLHPSPFRAFYWGVYVKRRWFASVVSLRRWLFLCLFVWVEREAGMRRTALTQPTEPGALSKGHY